MQPELVVFHTVPDLHLASGGTSQVVVDLTDALAREPTLRPVVVAQALRGEAQVSSCHPRVERRIGEVTSRRAWLWGGHMERALEQLAPTAGTAVIHNHGLWLPVNHRAAAFARRRRIPLLVHPHGMLNPGALEHRRWKKRLALALFQRADLEGCRALVATSEAEYENIRRCGLLQPVALIPNGVPQPAAVAPRVLPATRLRTVLFLSRIHPKKGLLSLIEAWARLRPDGWRLRVVGPDEGGHLQTVRARVKALGIDAAVEYLGTVERAQTHALFAEADLFVLPTDSENFGLVVAEALAHGVPVITTRGAPWRDLEIHRCGWWIETGVEPLVGALAESLALSDDVRTAMGARGRDYVRRFDWEAIAARTHALYRWAVGQGTRPESVLIT